MAASEGGKAGDRALERGRCWGHLRLLLPTVRWSHHLATDHFDFRGASTTTLAAFGSMKPAQAFMSSRRFSRASPRR